MVRLVLVLCLVFVAIFLIHPSASAGVLRPQATACTVCGPVVPLSVPSPPPKVVLVPLPCAPVAVCAPAGTCEAVAVKARKHVVLKAITAPVRLLLAHHQARVALRACSNCGG